MMNEEALCGDCVFLAQKPYRMQFHNIDGVDSFSFHSECGAITMVDRDKFLDWFIDEWELIEVKTYKCPCCSGYSSDYINNTTDKHEPSYYIDDGTFHITDHFFGTFCEFKIDYCQICGGKV